MDVSIGLSVNKTIRVRCDVIIGSSANIIEIIESAVIAISITVSITVPMTVVVMTVRFVRFAPMAAHLGCLQKVFFKSYDAKI